MDLVSFELKLGLRERSVYLSLPITVLQASFGPLKVFVYLCAFTKSQTGNGHLHTVHLKVHVAIEVTLGEPLARDRIMAIGFHEHLVAELYSGIPSMGLFTFLPMSKVRSVSRERMSSLVDHLLWLLEANELLANAIALARPTRALTSMFPMNLFDPRVRWNRG